MVLTWSLLTLHMPSEDISCQEQNVGLWMSVSVYIYMYSPDAVYDAKNVAKSKHIKRFIFFVFLHLYWQCNNKVQNTGHFSVGAIQQLFPFGCHNISRFYSSFLIINEPSYHAIQINPTLSHVIDTKS